VHRGGCIADCHFIDEAVIQYRQAAALGFYVEAYFE
jgi:hypothetical protein